MNIVVLILATGAGLSFLASAIQGLVAWHSADAQLQRKLRPSIVGCILLTVVLVGASYYSVQNSTSAHTSGSPSSTPSPTAMSTPISSSPSSTPSVTTTPTPSSYNYSTTLPGLICDTNGGTWKSQNLDGVSCPTAAGTELVINTGGSRGYLDLQQLPHSQAFSSNNTISVVSVLGDVASGYQEKCIGLAEQDATNGYSIEYCNTGDWFIASISSGGVILRKLDKGVVTMLTTAEISLTLKGTALSFSIENNVVDTVSISPIQPTKVAIVYDCVGYGAYQTIGGNYLLRGRFITRNPPKDELRRVWENG